MTVRFGSMTRGEVEQRVSELQALALGGDLSSFRHQVATVRSALVDELKADQEAVRHWEGEVSRLGGNVDEKRTARNDAGFGRRRRARNAYWGAVDEKYRAQRNVEDAQNEVAVDGRAITALDALLQAVDAADTVELPGIDLGQPLEMLESVATVLYRELPPGEKRVVNYIVLAFQKELEAPRNLTDQGLKVDLPFPELDCAALDLDRQRIIDSARAIMEYRLAKADFTSTQYTRRESWTTRVVFHDDQFCVSVRL